MRQKYRNQSPMIIEVGKDEYMNAQPSEVKTSYGVNQHHDLPYRGSSLQSSPERTRQPLRCQTRDPGNTQILFVPGAAAFASPCSVYICKYSQFYLPRTTSTKTDEASGCRSQAPFCCRASGLQRSSTRRNSIASQLDNEPVGSALQPNCRCEGIGGDKTSSRHNPSPC